MIKGENKFVTNLTTDWNDGEVMLLIADRLQATQMLYLADTIIVLVGRANFARIRV